ncbi:MAG: hypothetical protein AAGF99_03400 [Bacteroidota bacterium]
MLSSPPASRPVLHAAFLGAVLALLFLATGCASTNRLDEVTLDEARVAIIAAVPPAPRVQTGPDEAFINPWDPIGTAARVGTAVAKWEEARMAQAKLDSVARGLDVADRVARRFFVQAAEQLAFVPANRPADADYLLDLRVYDYGLVADSFEGAVFFALEADVLLVDRRTGREYWEQRVRERETLDASIFGMPTPVGNVITARALARLSEVEMQAGLERLADFTADRIAQEFRDDYFAARR